MTGETRNETTAGTRPREMVVVGLKERRAAVLLGKRQILSNQMNDWRAIKGVTSLLAGEVKGSTRETQSSRVRSDDAREGEEARSREEVSGQATQSGQAPGQRLADYRRGAAKGGLKTAGDDRPRASRLAAGGGRGE